MTDQQKSESPASAEEKFFGVNHPVQIPEPPEAVQEEPKPEVEVVEGDITPEPEPAVAKPAEPDAAKADDKGFDPELTDISEKVQKRINKLTYDREEAKRQEAAARKVSEEATRALQHLWQQNQQQNDIIVNGEARLISEFQGRAKAALEIARKNYLAASEEGDSEAQMNANEAIALAQAELIEANRYGEDYQSRMLRRQQQPRQFQQPQQFQQPRQPQAPVVAPPTERAKQWAKENTWFDDPKHPDMTSLAFGVHAMLKNKGIEQDSEEYFNEIDAQMRARFPEHFDGGQGQPATSTHQSPPTVVAPATRSSGAAPRKVKISAAAAKLAKTLGITPEQYATQLMKERKENV